MKENRWKTQPVGMKWDIGLNEAVCQFRGGSALGQSGTGETSEEGQMFPAKVFQCTMAKGITESMETIEQMQKNYNLQLTIQTYNLQYIRDSYMKLLIDATAYRNIRIHLPNNKAIDW